MATPTGIIPALGSRPDPDVDVLTRLRPLTPAELPLLPRSCERCALGQGARPGLAADGTLAGWARAAQDEWGMCGVAARHDEMIVGFLLVSPALHVPSRSPQARAGVTPGAAVMMTVRVLDDWTGTGLGHELIQAVSARLVAGRCSALESTGSRTAAGCTLPPAGWLESEGFVLVRDTPLAPRWRLDLTSTLRWRPRLDEAWKALGKLFPAPAPKPSPPEPAGFDPVPCVPARQQPRSGVNA